MRLPAGLSGLVVAGILSVFAYFFLYLMRRAKIAAAKEMSEGIAQ